MNTAAENLIKKLDDPKQEIMLARHGLKTSDVQSYLESVELPLKDILRRLHISSSTYFTRRKKHRILDSYTTEKFIRLILVLKMASEILGDERAKKWLYEKIPSLGNEAPLNLLDTEAGHRLVYQTLLQIKHGIYS